MAALGGILGHVLFLELFLWSNMVNENGEKFVIWRVRYVERFYIKPRGTDLR